VPGMSVVARIDLAQPVPDASVAER
jgi:hypothetical protein